MAGRAGLGGHAVSPPHPGLELSWGGVRMRVMRASFSGELGYEINLPAPYAHGLLERLTAAGTPLGVAPYGLEALMILRTEKGFLHVGGDTDGTTLPGDVTGEDWRRMVDVNLNGAFYCLSHAFKLMQEQSPQGGRIINNGSISAHVPRYGSIAYTATKHAVSGLTRAASLDGRAFSIAVGQIDIGNVASDMTERMAKGVAQADGTIKAEPRMDMSAVVETFMSMTRLPLSANVLFTTVMATNMPYVGRG